MIAYVVTTLLYALDHIRIIFADEAVQKDRGGQLELVQSPENPPNTDAQAVIAPGEIALCLRAVGAQIRLVASAGHEREVFDVQCDIERQPLAVGPSEIAPLFDGGIVVAIVLGQLQHGAFPNFSDQAPQRRDYQPQNRKQPGDQFPTHLRSPGQAGVPRGAHLVLFLAQSNSHDHQIIEPSLQI